MSEKYFNAYVDAAVGSIHEYVALTLQLKAQLRVANELLAENEKNSASIQEQIDIIENEKNAAIADMQMQLMNVKQDKDLQVAALTKELEDLRNTKVQSSTTLEKEIYSLRNKLQEAEQWKEKAKTAEESLQAMVNKVRHMDTLTKQYNDLKAQLLTVSKDYEDAKTRIAELEEANKVPKKVINNKTSSATKATVTKPKETNTDDF